MPEQTTETSSSQVTNLDSVVLLRGLAALAVCFFHFVKGFFPDDHAFRAITSFGWLGVESFFVISGFVIPIAMHRGGYTIDCYGRFMLKRWLRLAPPYLVSILVVIVLHHLSAMVPGFQGEPFSISWQNLGSHFFYLNDFLSLTWVNPVYWTLAIELQYYFAIALCYPVLFHRKLFVRLSAYVMLFGLGFLPWSHAIGLNWTFVFCAGIFLAQHFTKTTDRVEFAILITLATAATFQHNGLPIAIVTALTTVGIALIGKVHSSLMWLGMVSYSLYLLHVPIGGRTINLARRFADSDTERYTAVGLALVVSAVAAWAFYRWVEVPSHQASRRVRMRRVAVEA